MGSCYRANLSLTVTTTEAWRALPVDRRVNNERAAAIAGMLFCQDQLGGIWEIILTMTLPQPLSTVLKRSLRPGPLPIAAGGPGTFAQFTPRRSLVRSQYRPPGISPEAPRRALSHLVGWAFRLLAETAGRK